MSNHSSPTPLPEATPALSKASDTAAGAAVWSARSEQDGERRVILRERDRWRDLFLECDRLRERSLRELFCELLRDLLRDDDELDVRFLFAGMENQLRTQH